jgi:crossover junction endodeoxyribonuclease RusA
MQSVTLILPYPVSANRYWRSYATEQGTVRVVKTPEARVYQQKVFWLAKSQGIRKIKGNVRIRMYLYGGRMDIDNAIKPTLDALQGAAYQNDRQVTSVSIERMADDGAGDRLEVEVDGIEV